MSNLAVESHSLPTFEQRKNAVKGKAGNLRQKWLDTDEVISAVYVDMCNGMTKSDVMEKLTKGLYESQRKPVSVRSAYEYIGCAYQRMQYDFEAKAEELRADLYSKMMAVYQDCVQKGDRYNALQALDKIMKLTGVALDKPQNNIQVNANKDGITINFGFKKEETDED
jgi:hypothetical protein